MRIKVENITVAFIAASLAALNPALPVTVAQCAAVYDMLECEANDFADTDLLPAIADAMATIERHGDATKAAPMAYLLREAVMAASAAIRARRELIAAFPNFTSTHYTVIDAELLRLVRLDDPRSVGEHEAAHLYALMRRFK